MIPTRKLGFQPGVQLNQLVDGTGDVDAGGSDQVVAAVARLTRGRIDRPFLVNRENFLRKTGSSASSRVSALNEAKMQVFDALNGGSAAAVLSRLVPAGAQKRYALVDFNPAPPPRIPTSWDSAFNSNASISVGGRVSTISDPPGGNVQSAFGADSGRWYFEVTGVAGQWACGVARSDMVSAENSFVSPNAITTYSSNVYQSGIPTTAAYGYAPTATYGFEVLCETGQVWVYCLDGETEMVVGPFTLPSLGAGQTYRAMMQVGGAGEAAASLNAGQDDFFFGLPSGCEPIFGAF